MLDSSSITPSGLRSEEVPSRTPIPLRVLSTAVAPPPSEIPPPAPAHIRAQRRLLDSHGRVIRDLRISITDRCNFRCVYCMEPDVRFAPPSELLSAEEIVRMARIATAMGVRKIRLTGGEPMLHPNLREIIASIRASCEAEIAMITNGSLTSPARLRDLKSAGLDRITISIDSVRPDRFAAITRSASTLEEVLATVRACIDVGLTPVKLNAVLIRGRNDDEAADLAGLARELGVEVRFIEYMPLDSGHEWDSSKWVPAAETRAAIEEQFPLVACDAGDPSATARVFRFADGAPGRIGFIAPVSTPFCGACSRLRLTADGKVRPCLFSTREWDIRSRLRAGATDDELAEFLVDATWTKQAGHGIATPGFHQPDRPMSAIGG